MLIENSAPSLSGHHLVWRCCLRTLCLKIIMPSWQKPANTRIISCHIISWRWPSFTGRMVVSWNRSTPSYHPFNGIFHSKPSSLGCPHIWKPPYHLVCGPHKPRFPTWKHHCLSLLSRTPEALRVPPGIGCSQCMTFTYVCICINTYILYECIYI